MIRRGLAVLTLVGVLGTAMVAPAAVAANPPAPLFSFVSAPDMWNTDVGDLSGSSGFAPAPGFVEGSPNSTNEHYEAATDAILDEIARPDPAFVLVAGDAVEGRWDEDADGAAMFGSVTDLAGKRRAVNAAADLYYPQWLANFEQRGLEVHAAVGDHELGDNPWPPGSHPAALAPVFKQAWARHFTRPGGIPAYSQRPHGTPWEDTAYAIRRGPLLVITVDVFHTDGLRVRPLVAGGQLRWLRSTLRRARMDPSIRFIAVQGHVPVIGPVRWHRSSRLHLRRGPRSPFWQTLQNHGVDLYLCGEVHDTTAIRRGGVWQISHGGAVGWGDHMNVLVVDVHEDRLDMQLRTAPVANAAPGQLLWQTGDHRPKSSPMVGEFAQVGTMTLHADRTVSNRTGRFLPYRPF
ncbi:MAG TPA: metallophosphoesterase [Egibacteraceae bacterium]|nr:metallophosphoesterase [Egibacteraceae bacterium]